MIKYLLKVVKKNQAFIKDFMTTLKLMNFYISMLERCTVDNNRKQANSVSRNTLKEHLLKFFISLASRN